jgi:hypothetical protein
MRIALVNSISILSIILILITAYELRKVQNPLRILLLTICWFSMVYFPHCLAHYVVGRLLGVEFSHYTLSKSMLSKAGLPIVSRIFSVRAFLTLRIKRRSGRMAMFAMFLAGPLASMFSPFAIPLIVSSYDQTSAKILTALTIFNIIFTGYFSYKHGCIRKALNSLK